MESATPAPVSLPFATRLHPHEPGRCLVSRRGGSPDRRGSSGTVGCRLGCCARRQGTGEHPQDAGADGLQWWAHRQVQFLAGFQVACYKCTAINAAILSEFLNLVRSSGHAMSSRLYSDKACWLWFFLLMILLPASRVNASEDSLRFEQGSCRFDLTSVATLSCVLPNSAWQSPSTTCCKALLYAIDHVPPIGERGSCCLCRYMRAKKTSSKLVTAYLQCKGKDRHRVAKWSSFPIGTCSIACEKGNNSSIDMGTSARKDKDRQVVHDTNNGIFKIIWLAASMAFVMGLFCFWYFRRFKAAANPSEQHTRGRRKKYSTRSPTELKGRRHSRTVEEVEIYCLVSSQLAPIVYLMFKTMLLQ